MRILNFFFISLALIWSKCHRKTSKHFIKSLCDEIGFYMPSRVLAGEQRWAHATFFRVHNRNSATWRKHFRNRNSTTFYRKVALQPQLRNFAITIFSEVLNIKFATWEFTFANFGIFLAVKSGRLMRKYGGKKSHASVPLRHVFGFHRNRQFLKYFWIIFNTILSWGKWTRK
jgi:hypothetical protein